MPATVLVVEDDDHVRELVIEILGDRGFAAFGVGNGEEALQHLRTARLHPALILLDLMMPVMDGWQFRNEQLKDPALARIPVVVMSASDDGEVSAHGHVGKPFDIEELLGLVARLAPESSTLH
ncbi:MAG TPA: response regulator [Anaeromyxobacteraceae bacterium]